METISTFVEAFVRDRYQYEIIEKEIEAYCKGALQGIDCLWQSRVKAAKSLENKLKARSENYKNESANVADACDLVAGRIILARWVDFKRVENIIETSFNIVNRSQHPKPGRDIGSLHSRFRGYDGLHFYVKRHFSADQYLPDLVIEIQIMSAFMWAFSTLDHDITYKKLSGEPDENTLQSLDLLKGIANLGEIGLQIFDAQFLSAAKLSPQQHGISSELQATVRFLAGEVKFEEDDKQCLRNLRVTDPRDDKSRIEVGKDRLLEGSCSWILKDPAFIDWWTGDYSRLLWIHGDPGKGKTMMMIALIAEIGSKLESLVGTNVLTYFFCENTNSDLNTTVSVIRGLIYLLIDQEKALVCHLRKRYDSTGRRMFEGLNTQYALLDVLLNILKDPRLGHVCLMIDALDECDSKIYELLEWIIEENAELSSKIKWLVTSRNAPAFIERLGHGKQLHTSLEMNSSHVTHAVCSFIDHKVKELASLKLYNSSLQAFIRDSLLEKSEGTFLWVALVCKELKRARRGKEKSFLQATPAGLVPLYERMLNQVLDQEDANDAESCRRIICSVILAFRPLRLKEIAVFAKITESDVEVLVDFCGSFITVREQTAYLIHQSAKDYLGDRKRNNIFPLGLGNEHTNTASLCLEIMSASLRSDVCNLKDPGTCRDDIDENVLRACIPFHVQYACLHWVGHLQLANHTEQESFLIHGNCQVIEFFKCHFLHWIETLGLIGRISEAIFSITSLCSLPKPRISSDLSSFVRDARRFTLECRSVIESSPLQLYVSALIFSPEKSIVKRFFSDQIPGWIEYVPRVEKEWSSTLQTLENPSNNHNMVAFSPNGQSLASGSDDKTVKIWDPTTGDLRFTLSGHKSSVNRIAFSPDGQLMASVSYMAIKFWNPLTGYCRNTLETSSQNSPIAFSPDGQLFAFSPGSGYVDLWDLVTEDLRGRVVAGGDNVYAITFSPNGRLLASGSHRSIRLWDPITEILHGELNGHLRDVNELVFSPNGNLLASVSRMDHTIRLWDPVIRRLRCKIEGSAAAFSPNGRLLASASDDNIIRLWDTCSYDLQGILEGHSDVIRTIVFSPDGDFLASASDDKTVRLWDPNAKASRNVYQGHCRSVKMALFSPDGLVLASASCDNTVRFWDLGARGSRMTSENHSGKVNAVAFSSDNRLLASASDDTTIKIWDPITGHILNTLEGHGIRVIEVVFSFDDRLLASASGGSIMDCDGEDHDFTVRLWDPISGESRGKFDGHSEPINTLAFSPDGQYLASGSGEIYWFSSEDSTVRLWDPSTGESRAILEGHLEPIRKVIFSPNSQLVASASGADGNSSEDNTIRLWNPITGDLQGVLEGHSKLSTTLVFSPNSHLLISASCDNTVRLWDVTKRTLLWQIQHQYTRNISFRENGSRLILDARVFEVSSSFCTTSLQEQNSADSSYLVSIGDHWVCWRGRKVLRLPFQNIPSAYALRDNMLASGSEDGGMTFIIFSKKILPL